MLPEHQDQTTAPEVLRTVDRALAELRRGAPVLLRAEGGGLSIVQAAETTSDDAIAELESLADAEVLLVLTARRAAALGLGLGPAAGEGSGDDGKIQALVLAGRDAQRVAELVDPTAWKGGPLRRQTLAAAPQPFAEAAVELAKLARLLPAALLAVPPAGPALEAWAARRDLFSVDCAAVTAYRFSAARALQRVAEARIPLLGAEDTRVVAFRPDDGGTEHMALLIGRWETAASQEPVLVRLHSECFTGDLLGSLRCDCGDQLRGAVEAIGKAGRGVLLYLTQEGRGIGLVNKLRAYALQDQGADTAEANETLGFDSDERVYLPAAEMLHQLGIKRVRLLTNNPGKVAALERFGVEVVERVAHSFPSNSHNDFYLATKARRFGHMF